MCLGELSIVPRASGKTVRVRDVSPPGSLQCLWNEMTTSNRDCHYIAADRARKWKVWHLLGCMRVCAVNTFDELMWVYVRTNAYKAFVIQEICTLFYHTHHHLWV